MFRSENTFERAIALILILMGVVCRVMPHPDNFTPTLAIALFGGVALPPSLALWVPLLLMMTSDLILGLHPLFWLVWSCFFLVSLAGSRIRERAGLVSIGLTTLTASILFFVLTNLGVFLFENMYPKTGAGLMECFTMALPFFRNSVLGDIFYTFILFGLFAFAKRTTPRSVSNG